MIALQRLVAALLACVAAACDDPDHRADRIIAQVKTWNVEEVQQRVPPLPGVPVGLKNEHLMIKRDPFRQAR